MFLIRYIDVAIVKVLESDLISFERINFRLIASSLCYALSALALAGVSAISRAEGPAPVYIGLDEAYSQKTNTAVHAIETGIRIAIEEINQHGGVLGGRPLALKTTDNQGISAIAKDNFESLAAIPDMVAIMGGRYSPIVVETIPLAQKFEIPTISVWGSADQITDTQSDPSYAFRLSLKDSWGVEAMMRHALTQFKAKRICAILPSTAWGRSSDSVLKSKSSAVGVEVTTVRWYNWGETNMAVHYTLCKESNAQAILLVANEREASILINQIASVPDQELLPIVAHWGVTGGTFFKMVGNNLKQVTLDVIQTFSFIQNPRLQAQNLARSVMKREKLTNEQQIVSPVGIAQAYDMTKLIAMAVQQAQTTKGSEIRRALESLPVYEGAIKRYDPAFTVTNHDALGPEQVVFVKFDASGALIPIKKLNDAALTSRSDN